MLENPFQIAIDGPVGSGKSTVTRLVAERLGFLYVDTGAMYRTVALLCIRSNMTELQESLVVPLIEKSQIILRSPRDSEKDGRLITVLLDGEDISWAIRTQEVSKLVPQVAAMPQVRKLLVALQQQISAQQSVVMEGRDVTYRVLPQAQLKIYLTASPLERAQRRHSQVQSKGEDISLDDVLADLTKRDEADMSRTTDPLQIVDDAWVFDTTGITIDRVVDSICAKVQEKMEA